MKITCEFIPDSNRPTHANSIIDFTELYLDYLKTVLTQASRGVKTHVDFLLSTKIHPYFKFRKIATKPEKLTQKLNTVNSITKAYVCNDNGNVLIRFVNANDDNIDVHVNIAQKDLLRIVRDLKCKTLLN